MEIQRTVRPATASPPLARRASKRPRAPALPPVRRAVPGNDFLEHLRRETRRSMRSGAALSLALYRVDGNEDGDRLLEILHCTKRETDYLGHVADDLVAVLCTDTDAQGARVFALKIETLCLQAPPPVLASFPDPLFDRLLDGRASLALGAQALGAPWQVDTLVTYRGKRLLDIVGATAALLLLGLPMLLIALLVVLESRGPAIYRQTRLGHGGRGFVFYKFRTMVTGADDATHRAYTAGFVAGQARAASGSDGLAFKIGGDPRITRLGHLLRRSSLDELPQLFNVLKGDMSLVGPRPAIPYETEHYQAWHLRRILTVRPGITGIWQVEGRSRVSFNDMVRMDLRYIHDCSLLLDLRILLRTVGAVVRADGAG